MTSASKRLAELCVAPAEDDDEADDIILLGADDVELIDAARRVRRSEHRCRTSRVTPRRDRSRWSSAPPRPANDVAAPPPRVVVARSDADGTARIALAMAALLFLSGLAMLLNPTL
jgi:hypothetical protein